MAKKGISPVIAVVILIAVAVTIGGVVSSWVNSLVTETAKQDTCSITTSYSISEARYNSSSGDIRIKIRNTGRDSLYNFTVEADNGTVIAHIVPTSPVPNQQVGPGMSQYIIANTTYYNITNVKTVTVLLGCCTGYSSTPIKVTNI
jgi:flagellin-like protein